MEDADKVKLAIYIDSGTIRFVIITDRSEAAKVFEAMSDIASAFLTVRGRVHDIDANEVKQLFRKQDINSIEMIEVNSNY